MTFAHHDERERLLHAAAHHPKEDLREDDALKTTRTTRSGMKSSILATIGAVSLMICCAFVAMTASSSESSSLGISKFRKNNNGLLLNVYGTKEAGASTASRAKFSATNNKEEESLTQTAQLGYADVDLDTAALGAKERNMIQASLAIEDVQRKIKRLEKAKRQRALNVQDEDEYLEDEVTADVNVGEGEEEAVATATTGAEEEEEEEVKEKEREAEDERNAAVRMLTGEDPVVEENEVKEGDESNNDEAEKALPQASSTIVNQKLEEELKEEEKNNASAESEESVEEKKSSLEEMALAFEKEMERAALEDEFTATPEEEVKEGEQEPEATATAEVDPSETANEKTPEEGEEEEEEQQQQQGEQGEIVNPLESLTTTTTIITPRQTLLLRGLTKRDLSDTEFSKLQKLLEYNAKKRGVDLKSSSSADTTPEQPPKAELCPSSAIYAGKCECSSCALVLPMPDMVGTSLGKEIDSHECVARMNAQYIEVQNPSDSNKLANPRDYGSKTDFVFSNVVDHTLTDLRENLNTTEGKKLNQKVKHKFLHVPFWRPASEVFDFLEAHNDWKTIPHAVTKEATDLFSQMKGAEGKQWSSGFLAYVMLSRHYCAKTTVYSYWRAEEDPASQVYVTNSKGGARKMWSGHSFGGEHEFIKNAAESHDFGTRVRYLDALKEGANKGEEVGGITP